MRRWRGGKVNKATSKTKNGVFTFILTFILRCDKIIVGPGTTPITKNEDSVYSKGDDTHRKKT